MQRKGVSESSSSTSREIRRKNAKEGDAPARDTIQPAIKQAREEEVGGIPGGGTRNYKTPQKCGVYKKVSVNW
jgi:hypothetical protein